MPSSLAASAAVEPEASLPSASRSLRTICSGEYPLPNFESPPSAHLGHLDSHRNWTRFRGSGHHTARFLRGPCAVWLCVAVRSDPFEVLFFEVLLFEVLLFEVLLFEVLLFEVLLFEVLLFEVLLF